MVGTEGKAQPANKAGYLAAGKFARKLKHKKASQWERDKDTEIIGKE
jgi:hypothetical protein